MENNAFTGGVRPGGLTNETQIRLLLCYMIKTVPGLSIDDIADALVREALVNYFEIGPCLTNLIEQKLVTQQEDSYFITETGKKVADEIAFDLPSSVREKALGAAIRKQTWNKKSAEYKAELTHLADDSYNVECSITSLDKKAFCLNLNMPDRFTAELVQEQFTLNGSEIYGLLLTKLTENTK